MNNLITCFETHIPTSFPQGLNFVDTLYVICTTRNFDCEVLDFECKRWIRMLLELVDVTGDDSCALLERFFGKSTHTVTVKEYQDDIIKEVSVGK